MNHLVITGLRLRSRLHAPLFAYHALRSMAQAEADPACRHAEARTIAGVAHTVTLWDDAAAARAYGISEAHRRAAAVFHRIATGAVYAGPAGAAPGWAEARRLWEARGVEVVTRGPTP